MFCCFAVCEHCLAVRGRHLKFLWAMFCCLWVFSCLWALFSCLWAFLKGFQAMICSVWVFSCLWALFSCLWALLKYFRTMFCCLLLVSCLWAVQIDPKWCCTPRSLLPRGSKQNKQLFRAVYFIHECCINTVCKHQHSFLWLFVSLRNVIKSVLMRGLHWPRTISTLLMFQKLAHLWQIIFN